jgi:hypothetical protein
MANNRVLTILMMILLYSVSSFADGPQDEADAKALADIKQALSEDTQEHPVKDSIKAQAQKEPEVVKDDSLASADEELALKKFHERKGDLPVAKEKESVDVSSALDKQKENSVKHPYISIDRDSTKIINVTITVNDVVNVPMCHLEGLQIKLAANETTTINEIKLSDKTYFDVAPLQDKRGAFVKLNTPMLKGQGWESLLWITKSDSTIYNFRLIALPCVPNGDLSPFPTTIYIHDASEHIASFNPDRGETLVPHDMVLEFTEGYKEQEDNKINIYGAASSAGMKWWTYGVEVNYPAAVTPTKLPRFIAFDNVKYNKIDSKVVFLPGPSRAAIKARGVTSLRLSVTLGIDKSYIIEKRFIHVYILFDDTKTFHHKIIDTFYWWQKAKQSGFTL